jgi:hypothetical protein
MRAEDIRKAVKPYISGMVPALFSQVWRSTNQTLSDSALTAISFDTVIRDDPGCWAVGSATRLTVKAAGAYILTGGVSFNTSATGRRVINLQLNGATYLAYQVTNGVSGAATHMSLAAIKYLAVGDYIELIAYQNSGGSLAVLSTTPYTPLLSMAWIGG